MKSKINFGNVCDTHGEGHNISSCVELVLVVMLLHSRMQHHNVKHPVF